VDLRSGEVRKHGLKIKLQDQPFQVLALLLEHPGDVVTREQLRQKLWAAETFVDFDVGLNTAIKRLRDALSDSPETPRFIETLPRRGYRFIATTEEVLASVGSLQSVATPAVGIAEARGPSLPLKSVAAAPSSGQAEVEKGRAQTNRLRYALALGGVATVILLAMLLGLNLGGLRDRLLRRADARRIRSLAVLPLENLTGDSSQDYFVDGMTEELITDLGKIGELRVISRTSTMHYKGTHKTLPQIGRELNVDAVIEGAVLRSGDRVRITAQLVEAPSDRHLWAESYERDLRDVLALQDEVARAIANEVKIKLSPQEQIRLASARPVDPEAYEDYLKGRYEWNKWSEEGLKKSVEYFEQAVQKDPGYAQAWAGLSDAYNLLGLFGSMSAQVASPKAKAAALKALELDETLSEAHVSLGAVKLHQEWSWSAAEKECQRAIALDPNNAMAHQWYGYLLMAMGRLDEAIAEMKHASELDPFSPNKQNSLGAALYNAGRYDEALQQIREVPDGDHNTVLRHRRMAAIYERKGMQSEAITELLTVLRLGGQRELAAFVEQKYRASDYPQAKKAFLWGEIMELQKRGKNGHLAADQIADDYALLGEKDKAFEWLETAFQERAMPLMYLKVDHSFDTLRSDPRFQDLVRRMGLPP
jgi:TolB-like protein/DNA-binding winged helix-turn-helix (wHTH) protein/Tfp pilus assembly protein PilF